MRANDEVSERIAVIRRNRIVKAAKTTMCAGCPFIGIPSGAFELACCDPGSETYHQKITALKACRRWKK